MKGSFQVAKAFDIPVKIHWSFGLFILYILYVGTSNGNDWPTVGLMVLAGLLLFFCVVLHEYGHALTARKFGVSTRDIILSPIGGVARLERLPEKPIQEFYVAIAGPLVNIAIVLIIIPIMYFTFGNKLVWGEGFLLSFVELLDFKSPLTILPFLVLGNIALAGFNLLPAFPMDGGRIFRSLLSIKFGRLRATQVASFLGSLFGIAMIAMGAIGALGANMFTSLIGIFVLLMAVQEYRMVKMETVLKSKNAGDLSRQNFTKIYLDDTMEGAIREVKTGNEKSFLVFDQFNNLAGVLHELFIREAIRKKDDLAPVAEYLSINYEGVQTTASLNELLRKMQQHGYSILPVYFETELVGVIDVTMMNNFLRKN